MELKPFIRLLIQQIKHLLIVPYGIETEQFGDLRFANVLLIVPYGIET